MKAASVLFVCLGNICRSPMAEGAFRAAAAKAGLDVEIDSCGTADYHIGQPPDKRAIAEAGRNGADISGFRGRQLASEDFTRFTHILAADEQNLRDIEARRPADASATTALLLDVVPGQQGRAVADPYYGDESHFAATWREVDAAAQALVAVLLDEVG